MDKLEGQGQNPKKQKIQATKSLSRKPKEIKSGEEKKEYSLDKVNENPKLGNSLLFLKKFYSMQLGTEFYQTKLYTPKAALARASTQVFSSLKI